MMNERLKKARLNAGFKTATEAIEVCGWAGSTYRAHENGQNGFKINNAKDYGKAYGVNPSWLIFGERNDSTKSRKQVPKAHKHNCAEHIYAAAILLREDPSNTELIQKIEDCVASLKSKGK